VNRLALDRKMQLWSVAALGFGLYLASSDRYENQLLPTGFPSGTPEEALDFACRLYLDNPAT
jgi:hypothetical protein